MQLLSLRSTHIILILCTLFTYANMFYTYFPTGVKDADIYIRELKKHLLKFPDKNKYLFNIAQTCDRVLYSEYISFIIVDHFAFYTTEKNGLTTRYNTIKYKKKRKQYNTI